MTDLYIEEMIDKFGFERIETYGLFENGELKEIKYFNYLTNKFFISKVDKVKNLENYKFLYVTHDEEYNLIITENKILFNNYEQALILVNKREKLLKVIMKANSEEVKQEINLEKESKGSKMIST